MHVWVASHQAEIHLPDPLHDQQSSGPNSLVLLNIVYVREKTLFTARFLHMMGRLEADVFLVL